MDPGLPPAATGDTFPAPAGRFPMRRIAWHLAGLLAAGILAWLIMRGYSQPELLLDIVNMRLC